MRVFQTSILCGVTPIANEAGRVDVNTWLRAGAPIDATTKAAVAVGTSGALLMRSPGHPLTGYHETADIIETARNSGSSQVGMLDNTTHPTSAGHIALTAGITLSDYGL